MKSSSIELAYKYLGPKECGNFSPKTYLDKISLCISKISITVFRLLNFLFGDRQWHNNQSAFRLVKEYADGAFSDSNLELMTQLYKGLQERDISVEEEQKKEINKKLNEWKMLGDFSQLDPDSLSSIIQKIPTGFSALNTIFHDIVKTQPSSFDFTKKPISFEEFKMILKKNSDVESITLPKNATDAYLEFIKENFPHLRKLSFIRCRSITEEGYRHLSGLSKLEELNFDGTGFRNSDMIHLKGLTELRSLELLGCGSSQFNEEGFRHLSFLKKLEKLGLEGNYISKKGLKALGGLIQLRDLDLNYCMVEKGGFNGLAGLTELRVLKLRSVGFTGMELASLTGLTKLENLEIAHTDFAAGELAHISSFTALQHLQLSGCKFRKAGVESLSKLTKLKTLCLGATDIVDADSQHLASLINLEEIYLTRTKISGEFFRGLSNMVKLKRLKLPSTNFNDAGLEQLSQFTKLENLHLTGCNITDEGFQHLYGLTSLQNLHLSAKKEITKEACALLRKRLTKLSINIE